MTTLYQSKTVTLVAGTAATVTIGDTFPHGITINNLSGSAAGTVWYRLDGTDPTVEGDNCFPCFDSVFIPHPAVDAGYTPTQAAEPVAVKVISSAALKVNVEGNRVWGRTS